MNVNRTVVAAGVVLACAAGLSGCTSDPAAQGFDLSGGVTVQVKAPGGWQARGADGTVLLTPKGDDRDLAGLTDAVTAAQLGAPTRGANYLTVMTVDQCGGNGKWVWSIRERTNSDVRTGEVRRKADGGCIAVHATYAQAGGGDSASGDDSASKAEPGPPAVDLLEQVMAGDIVTD